MALYRKKPVVIEAFQWTGDADQIDDPVWIVEAIKTGKVIIGQGILQIETLEGVMEAKPGDWIIKGVQGEIYPCKPDIFEQTYEQAGNQEEYLITPEAVFEVETLALYAYSLDEAKKLAAQKQEVTGKGWKIYRRV